jgi:hypothetical protein
LTATHTPANREKEIMTTENQIGRLTVPRWHVEITVSEQPFPFVVDVSASNERAAFSKARWQAGKCGLTPVLNLSCELSPASGPTGRAILVFNQ